MTKQSCTEALQRLYEYLDDELSPEEAQRIKDHFERCGGCGDFLTFCDAFKHALQRAAEDQPSAPPELREKVSAILRKHCASPVSYSSADGASEASS
jgi:anti-sigma factor (TIGR02949 family)